MEKTIKIKTIEFFEIIFLYYITKNYNLFPFTISLSLYYIFKSCFANLKLSNIKEEYLCNKSNMKLVILLLLVISFCFLILSILLSDVMNTILDTNDMFLVFLFMGLSISSEPLINIYSEYLMIMKHKSANTLYNSYYILELVLYIIISFFSFKILKLPNNIAISLLYLPKIISIILISILWYFILKNKKELVIPKEKSYNYQVVKKIFKKNIHKSFIKIINYSYLYISIVLVYLVLTTRYNYNKTEIYTLIPIVYLYLKHLVNYYLMILNNNLSILGKNISYNLYSTLKLMLPLTIIGSIVSPIICQILFNNPNISLYLSPLLFLAIFEEMYLISYDGIYNKKIVNISLIIGIFSKIIITIPLINAFYRMGYNLIYGDILSTSLSLFISIGINYLYSKNKYHFEEKYLGKILSIFYENILLSIVLIITQFIIPLHNLNYLKSLVYLPVYLAISILFIKIKNEKRG